MKNKSSYFKNITLVIFTLVSSLKLFGIYVIQNPFEQNVYAFQHIKNQIFSLFCNYLKSDSAFHIPDSLYDNISLIFKYSPEGELSAIENLNANRISPIFSEQDMLLIYDYFKNLPPFEIPNTEDKIWDRSIGKYIYKDTIKENYYNYLKVCGDNIWCNTSSTYIIEYTDSGTFDKINVDSILPKIQLDTIFGEMNWVEVKKRYYAAGEEDDDYFRKKEINKNHMYGAEYSWTKIPIDSYNVYIQLPDSSKIDLSPDLSFANIYFPDSSYLYLNYSKDKVNDFNPSKYNYNFFDKINDMKVNDKYILSEGNEDIDDGKEYFARIRFRHGITATVYTDDYIKLMEFIKYTLKTITTTIRP